MTDRNDYKNFHLRLEARIRSASADSGISFDYAGQWGHQSEVNITFDPNKLGRQTGSIKVYGSDEDWIKTPVGMGSPNEWFTLEVIARDSHILAKVNGRVASESLKRKLGSQGHILLQQRGGQTAVEFRKIEIIELDEYGKPLRQPTSPKAAPLTIGMNDEFGMLFEGRLVAPAELSRLLREALTENPDRVVAIDLPKKKWTVAGHVDQLEQIARIVGAKHISRPAWSEIRIVLSVVNSSMQVLDINGPGYTATGFFTSHLPNVREVVTKNPGLPVLLDIAKDIDLTDPKIAEGIDEVRRIAEAAGAKVRLAPQLQKNAPLRSDNKSMVEVQRFGGHRAPVRSVAFSPDGKLIASAGGYSTNDYTVRIWDRESGRALHVIAEHKASVMFVAFSPDGSRLLTGDLNRQQYLWNPATGAKVGEWVRKDADPSQVSHINEVVFSPDGARIYFVQVGKKPAVCVADAASGEMQSLFPLEQAARPSIDLTRDGLQLLVPCSDGTVLLVDAKDGKTLRTYPAPKTVGTYAVSAWVARQSPDGAKVAVGYTGSLIRVWDFESGNVLRDIATPDVMPNQLAFLADNRRLVAAGGPHDPKSKSPVALLCDTETGEVLARAPATLKTVRAFALAPDQRHLLTDGGQNASQKGADASGDFDLRLWRLPEAVLPAPPQPAKINLLRELPSSKEWITAVAYPENDRVVTVAVDGVVRVWKNGGAELESHQLPFGGQAAISPDGRLLVVASASNDKDLATVTLWELDEWKERWKIEVPTTTTKFTPKFLVDVRFAPNDRVIVRGNVDSGVAIVDAANGNILSRFPEKGPAIGATAVSPDGKRLFVRQMAPAPLGRIYRIEDGAELATIDTRDVVLDAVWSRDGAQLILAESTLNEGRIAVFEASTGKLIRRWIAEPKGIESLALGQGNLLATGGLTRIAIWNWSMGKLLATVDSPKQGGDARLAIALSPDGKRLISGGARWLDGEDKLPRLWQLPESVWPK